MSTPHSKRPRVTAPMPALMTQVEIDRALKRDPKQLRLPFWFSCCSDPADGVDSHERRMLYRKKRARDVRSKLWYWLHVIAMRKIKKENDAAPLSEQCGAEQVYNFREQYARCRLHGFCTDPWERAHIDEKFDTLSGWTVQSIKASEGVRKGWTFEQGFDKTFRLDPKWNDVKFDEDDLGPEETAPGVSAKDWLHDYTKRQAAKPRRFHNNHRTAEVTIPNPPPPSRSSTFCSPNAHAPLTSTETPLALESCNITEQLGACSISSEYLDRYSVHSATNPVPIRVYESATTNTTPSEDKRLNQHIQNKENNKPLGKWDSRSSMLGSNAQTPTLAKGWTSDVLISNAHDASPERTDSALEVQ